MWQRSAYPAPRTLDPPPQPSAVPRYERIDGPSGETTLGDSDATVHTFSGTPDLILLNARTNSAFVTLTDRLNRETHAVTVLVGNPVYVYVGRERVVARNLVAGNNALLSVTGFWAERNERGSDPRRGTP